MAKEIEIPEGYEARIDGNKVIIELKETEDERIRKELYEFIKVNSPTEDANRFIAWLEKQKEQNDKDEGSTDFTIYHPLKNGKGEYECIPYSFYGSLTSFSEDKDLIDFLRTCFYTEEDCNEWIEQQKEQKPAEWSEEDRKMLDAIIKRYSFPIETDFSVFVGEDNLKDMREELGWLKSLRPQPRQEWSEEDKKRVVELKTFIAKCNGFNKANQQKAFELIDELRPQPHWKPSEEHFQGLRRAITKAEKGSDAWNSLTDLYEQLKKL